MNVLETGTFGWLKDKKTPQLITVRSSLCCRLVSASTPSEYQTANWLDVCRHRNYTSTHLHTTTKHLPRVQPLFTKTKRRQWYQLCSEQGSVKPLLLPQSFWYIKSIFIIFTRSNKKDFKFVILQRLSLKNTVNIMQAYSNSKL